MPTKPEFRQSQWDGSVERRAPNPDAFGLILHRLDSMESKQDDLQGSLSELAKCDSVTLNNMAAALNLTPDQLDQLFTAAAAIVA